LFPFAKKKKKKKDILFSLSLSLSFPKNKQTAYQLNMGDEGEHLIITTLSPFGSPKVGSLEWKIEKW